MQRHIAQTNTKRTYKVLINTHEKSGLIIHHDIAFLPCLEKNQRPCSGVHRIELHMWNGMYVHD